jgi:putative transposase
MPLAFFSQEGAVVRTAAGENNGRMFQRHPTQNEELMFITTNTLKRRPVFHNPKHAREAVDTLYRVQELHPFFLYAFVFMPDHCHLLLRVPAPEQISRIMRVFKYGSSININKGPIWQSRFHLKVVSDAQDVIGYIHRNPVTAGLAAEERLYPWSSACGKWDVTELAAW